jgi:CDP-diacylglycerol--serine O-phosphatidyltransferase
MIKRERSRRRLRKVYLLPNLLTAFNMFLGFWAICSAFDGHIERACWLVFLAMWLDGLDGLTARLTHTQSDFGLEFDSLSDLVSFGVAPAVIIFTLLTDLSQDVHPRLALGVSAVYAICGALRLARYNIQAHGSERHGFIGLPIPAAAGTAVMSILMINEYQLLTHMQETIALVLPLLTLLLAMLMVSEVPYPDMVHNLRLLRRLSFDSLPSLVFIGVLVFALKSDMRVLLVWLMGIVYVSFGPTRHLVRSTRKQPAQDAKTTESLSQ